ncbi:MAG: glycosyltransferase family 2 protein [candidate division WOR-3 bacterium]
MKVSFLVPAFNEEECLPLLAAEIADFIEKNALSGQLECIIIDDGSSDRTYQVGLELSKTHPFIKLLRHSANLGKTQALITGAKRATGEVLVIFDADLQYSVEDAWRLALRVGEGWDIVVGWKQGDYQKKFVSWVYNSLSHWLFSLPIHDMNSLKALKAEVFPHLGLRRDWHRYIVPLAVEKGFTVTEEKVNLRPRAAGKSKYTGFWRIVIGFADLLAVKFQLTIMRKPLLYLGTAGFLSGLAGVLVGIAAILIRYIAGVGYRPALYLVILLVISGLMLISMGLVGELVAGIQDQLEARDRP